jgi:hypothetical protein
MKSVFQWRDHPSWLAGELQKKKAKKPDLEPKRLHIYAEATVSDQTREDQITQTNRECEYHFALAQKVTDDVMRGYHRDEARRLAAKARALILGRSEGFIAKLEQERGLR